MALFRDILLLMSYKCNVKVMSLTLTRSNNERKMSRPPHVKLAGNNGVGSAAQKAVRSPVRDHVR